MKYISTRNKICAFDFSSVVLEGLAPDGGLFIPSVLPDFSKNLNKFSQLSYQDLACEIFFPFCKESFEKKQLKEIIYKTYQNFSDPPCKLQHLKTHSILELFSGPTLSFKDYALQLLGNFFEKLLEKGKKINVLAATSGDTGSAAIYALQEKKNCSIVTLFPKNRISLIQKLQMATVVADNVFNLEVAGNFDDCQRIIKQVFQDLAWKKKYHLGAVNSINWARILGQITHYFYAGLKQKQDFPNEELIFSVPTGNFGHIYAGWLAKKMGLPIKKLLLATNENNILYRAFSKGDYSAMEALETMSPAMDIQKASNFERYLYYLYNEDEKKIKFLMEEFKNTGKLFLDKEKQRKIREDFFAGFATEKETEIILRKYYQEENYLMDTHTAVGVCVAEKIAPNRAICLATAHPAKFYQQIEKIIKKKIELPPELKELFLKPQKIYQVKGDLFEVKNFLKGADIGN